MKRSILMALTFGLVAAFGGTALAAEKKPDAGSMEETLLRGLILIRDGDFDGWISKYCGTRTLCWNDAKKKEFKRYNLPAAKKVVGHCIRAGDTALEIDRVGDEADGSKKVFLKCNPKGMPRPYLLEKEGDKWVFTGTGIY